MAQNNLALLCLNNYSEMYLDTVSRCHALMNAP